MKRIFSSILAVVFIISMLCAVPASAAIYGDVDSDGSVTPRDAIILARNLAGWNGYTIDEEASDVDVSGFVDAKDSVILNRHIARSKGYETLPFVSSDSPSYLPGIW